MEKIKDFFHAFYSFCVRHGREFFFSAIGFIVASVLWATLFLLPSCRGLWTMDFKGETEKGSVTTKINYVDNDIAVGCDGIEKKEENTN